MLSMMFQATSRRCLYAYTSVMPSDILKIIIYVKSSMSYQLNNSTSKQQFSFGRQSRFSTGHSTTPLCYNITAKRDTKGGVIPRASKVDWTQTSVVSPSAKYRLKSSFEESLEKNRGAMIGIGRQNIEKSNNSYIRNNQTPGPGQYELKKSHSQYGITIQGKSKIPCKAIFLNDKVNDVVPGPGKYETLKQKSKGGLITSHSVRFKESNKENPGPGTYEVQRSEKSLNRSLNGSQVSRGSTSFSRQQRLTFLDKQKSIAPGPGKYRIFSEFDSQQSIIKLRD